MKMSYLKNGETLVLYPGKCNGCRECIEVCPHAVFTMSGGKAQILDRGACMECGACARNCASGALTVKAGVGCAAAIIGGMLRGTEPTCGSCGTAPAGTRSECC
ncbi:MAG: mercury methylation ferredoxin HgcB [Spirochaetia bacterium]|jgi:NAD-dependent dihydropyrimidine dehydrogenase PreA subunit